MKKEQLVIKNFFTLKDVDIGLGKYNVFIGEQASGKSLLIKLISFFNSMLIPCISTGVSEYEQKFIEKFYTIFRVDYSMLHKDFYVRYKFNEFTTLSFNNDGENLKLKLDITSHGNPSLSGNFYQRFIPAGRTFLVDLHRNIFKLLNPLDTSNKTLTIDPLLFKFGEQYQDAMESFNSPRGHVPSPSEEMINNRNKHLKWFDEKFTNIIKGKYVYDSIGGFISQDTGDVRPWHSSSGQQETLPIYLVLRNYLYDRLSFGMSGSLYIEEPEAHLYPTAQKDILELFIYVANTINSDGLYITTHSPYILTVLNNLILANDVKEKQNIFDKDLLGVC